MTTYLETAISLILIFFIFSTIAYIVQELIAVNLQYRGRMLWRSLAEIFDNIPIVRRNIKTNAPVAGGATNTNAFYNHPQINSLRKNADRLPAYIPAANFALALLDEVAKKVPIASRTHILMTDVKTALATYINAKGDIHHVLQNLVDTSSNIKELQAKIESWYNDYMDRVTGWYKSHTIVTLRWIAVGVTLFFNINVIRLSKEIFTNTELRGAMVSVAEKVADHPENVSLYYTKNFENEVAAIDAKFKTALDTTTSEAARGMLQESMAMEKMQKADEYTKKRIAAMDSLSRTITDQALPLGWKRSFQYSLLGYDTPVKKWDVVWLLLGWAIAAGCISMGAPFWFDMLVKAVNLRRSGIKPTATDTKRQ